MGKTNIEWADYTFNPWIGCTKVSPACDHCYAERDDNRHKWTPEGWGTGKPRYRTAASTWRNPLTWNNMAYLDGESRRVFCASLADIFDNEVDPQWRLDLWELIKQTPHLNWLLLTKRIGNAPDMLPEEWQPCPPPNVWLGVTVVNQEEAQRDIPKLFALNPWVRFVSVEPMLGFIDLSTVPRADELDWLICGGERGAGARCMQANWVREIRTYCLLNQVNFFFKQWGEWAPNCFLDDSGLPKQNSEWMDRMGYKLAGRLLDRREWDQVPESWPFGLEW